MRWKASSAVPASRWWRSISTPATRTSRSSSSKTSACRSSAYYADASAKTFQDLKEVGRAFGMPTTVLVDHSGCELGTIAGPAEWSSPDAVTLIQAALTP